MQAFAAREGKPAGLRLGANLRQVNEDVLEDIENMDLFEIGLNPGRFTLEDIRMLEARGIVALANLMDTPAWWAQLPSMGCYGFKTNYAAAYSKFALV